MHMPVSRENTGHVRKLTYQTHLYYTCNLPLDCIPDYMRDVYHVNATIESDNHTSTEGV